MLFRIEYPILEKYPDVTIGVLVGHGLQNEGQSSDVSKLLSEASDHVVDALGNTDIKEHPHIACWREAYRAFGAKPKDYPSSIENLVRRVVKGESIRHINTLVDIYNYVSLQHLVPVGGEDLHAMVGDLLLTIAGEEESPVILLGEREARPPHQGEVIYKDAKGTVCRRWNWKEAERTKLTEQTTDAIIVIEGLPPVGRGIIEQAVSELAGLVQKECGGEVTTALLGKGNPEWELP